MKIDLKYKEKEIMEQHKKLFEALESNQPTTGYNYN
jgi:DNA-binding FadR family transcriptional regulator|tara:strand:+ start:203 stop:310 length:108 start_codon:yes stop_codon:yes gene_type:complete